MDKAAFQISFRGGEPMSGTVRVDPGSRLEGLAQVLRLAAHPGETGSEPRPRSGALLAGFGLGAAAGAAYGLRKLLGGSHG